MITQSIKLKYSIDIIKSESASCIKLADPLFILLLFFVDFMLFLSCFISILIYFCFAFLIFFDTNGHSRLTNASRRIAPLTGLVKNSMYPPVSE